MAHEASPAFLRLDMGEFFPPSSLLTVDNFMSQTIYDVRQGDQMTFSNNNRPLVSKNHPVLPNPYF
jgi:hypothetical protein